MRGAVRPYSTQCLSGGAAGAWFLSDPIVLSLFASMLFASASLRFAGLPIRSWDGFRTALSLAAGSLMSVALVLLAPFAGVPASFASFLLPLAVASVGVVLLYALPRLGLLSSDRVQHGRVIQAMNDGVLVVDMNGRLVDFNQAAGEILELDDRARADKSLDQALAHHPDLVELFSGAIDGRSLYSPEGLRRKGENRTFDLQLSALYDSAGSIASRVLVLRDISDRIEVEEENRRQSRHVRLVHEVSAAVHEAETIEAGLEAALALVANTTDLPLGHFLRTEEDEDEGSRLIA